ncbi:hypothetical protein FBY03_12956 [Pseudomonas sp. SJZ079]|nr:hypothetical protein FBY03_12956 [Pseudomonas sp. SJZ079]
MDLQIDDFYQDAARGLLLLYQTFPRKMALYVEDLIGREEADEFGLPSKRHQSCLGALLWLAEEGYLRFDSSIAYDALDQAYSVKKAFCACHVACPTPYPTATHCHPACAACKAPWPSDCARQSPSNTANESPA